MLVFSMGLVLMGGTVMLVGMVWKKISAEGKGAAPVYACAGGSEDLKGRGVVTDSVVEGNKLRLTLQQPGGILEIVTLDMCGGKESSALRVQTDGVKFRP